MLRRFACGAVAVAAFLAVSATGSVADTAVVHAGDQLQVRVEGEDTLSQTVTVAGDGTIGLPLVGQVRVGGASIPAADDAIAVALKRYLRDPHVTISVLNQGHVNVLVLGDVVNSGEYTLRPDAKLSDAITAAGGMASTIDGAYPVARVALADGTVYHISLDKLLRGGDPERDVTLTDRAAIYVPGPVRFDVTVLGAVDHPGTVSINEGDRLSIAIAKAGNSATSQSDLTRILVTRTEPDGTTASHPVNLYQSLEKGDTRFDPLLRKGDIVYVPLGRKGGGDVLSNALFVLGRLFFL